jgi:cell division protein FtsI (penicillin-binding protein 3)
VNFVRLARVRFLVIVLLLWSAVVVARLAELQLAHGSRYRARAQRQQERRIEISPQRGSIFDRNGQALAMSVPVGLDGLQRMRHLVRSVTARRS